MGKQNLEDGVLFQLSNENFSTIETSSTNVSTGNLSFIFAIPESDGNIHLQNIDNHKNDNNIVSMTDFIYKLFTEYNTCYENAQKVILSNTWTFIFRSTTNQ